MHSTTRINRLAVYSTAGLAALLVLGFVVKIWKMDLHVPLTYRGDALWGSVLIKSIIDTGSYLKNPSLGAPFGADWADFPNADSFHFLLLRIVTLFASDHAVVLNMFYLLTFPWICVVAFYVFQRLGLSLPFALTASLLYAFLPYHFFRGTDHLFLSSYGLVPLAVLVMFRIFDGHPPFIVQAERPKFSLGSWRSVRYAVFGLLLGSSGVYYAFFSSYLFLVAGTAASFSQRRLMPLISAGLLVLLVTMTVFGNVAPYISSKALNGANPEVAKRSSVESEIYGLKIKQLLLPVSGHRIPMLARVRNAYDRHTPLVNENGSVSLGVIASIGFLALMVVVFLPFSTIGQANDLRNLSLLNLAAVLLGTVGGFGSVFALIFPMIRSYNRIGVFVSFFSLLAVFAILERFLGHYSALRSFKSYWVVSLVLLSVGLYDQTTERFVPSYGMTKAKFEADARFINRIEMGTSEGEMIFQLPYVPFPENPRVNAMADYDHFRGYLHSKHLRWSYGVMKGREGDNWMRTISAQSIPELVDAISQYGFRGIYINRSGYADRAERLEAELSRLLGATPLVSSGGDLTYYDLQGYLLRQ